MFFSLHFKRSGLRLIKPLSRTWDLKRDLPVKQKKPLHGPLCTGEYCEDLHRTGHNRRTVSGCSKIESPGRFRTA